MATEATNLEKPTETLAAPFKEVFSSFDEAQWGFELLRMTLLKLGVLPEEADRDHRISLTLSGRSNRIKLRLNFGNWAIITFLNQSVGENRVQYICRKDLVPASSPAIDDGNKFADEIDGHTFVLASGPMANMRDSESIEMKEFNESLTHVAQRFKGWKGSPYEEAHQPKVLKMVFDSHLRDELLHEGLDVTSGRRFWWVNQGRTYDLAKNGEFIWAPKKDSSGSAPFHLENMSRVSPGDIVFNYADSQLRAVSLVKSSAYDSDRGALPDDWGKDGRRADLTYYELAKTVSIATLGPKIRDLDLAKGPVNRAGTVNQGYLYELNEQAAQIILQEIGEDNLPSAIREALDLVNDFTSATQSVSSDPKLPTSRNLILYGPPGTGKTFNLRNRYMELFTERQVVLTPEEHTAVLVQDLTWWEVIALVLLDSKDLSASVAEILAHPLVKARDKLSANKNVRATLRGVLQMHTKADCGAVKIAIRAEPLLFSKNERAVWSIDEQLAKIEAPELGQLLNNFHNHTKQPTSITRRYRFTTFHQSFSYEDFIEGIKPQMEDRDDGQIAYEIRDGVFKTICREAKQNPDKPYALFIDEINRGNVASIFGELITLIEDDKRLGAANELTATLPYSRDEFGVPKNLYIIGTMNTADRSVEALDSALRRRFAFEEMRPDSELIITPDGLGVDLRKLFDRINARLEQLLDHDHCIGHAYFMEIRSLDDLRRVFANKIIPLLREYFYGHPAKIGMVLGEPFVSPKKTKTDFAPGSWGMDDLDEKVVYEFADISQLSSKDFASIYA